MRNDPSEFQKLNQPINPYASPELVEEVERAEPENGEVSQDSNLVMWLVLAALFVLPFVAIALGFD